MKAYSQKMIRFEWDSDVKLTKCGKRGKVANKQLKGSERQKAKREINATLRKIKLS